CAEQINRTTTSRCRMIRTFRTSHSFAASLAALAVFAISGLIAQASALAADDEADFKSLFNGKDLSGWDGNPDFWSVKDGVITGQTMADNPTKGNTFLIWRDGKVDDFELRLSYRIVPDNDKNFANSGIQYRSK